MLANSSGSSRCCLTSMLGVAATWPAAMFWFCCLIARMTSLGAKAEDCSFCGSYRIRMEQASSALNTLTLHHLAIA